MSDQPNKHFFKLSSSVTVVVSEYFDNPARHNKNLNKLFCADVWWRIECWEFKESVPSLFATVIMIRVFDEKYQNKLILLRDRVYQLCIPVEGYFHDVDIMESEDALILQFSPDVSTIIGYVGFRLSETRNS